VTKTDLRCIQALGESLSRFAGEAVRAEVMKGSEQLHYYSSTAANKNKIAEWVKGAMDRLDALTDEGTRVQVMENCGYACISRHMRVIRDGKARRRKLGSIEDYIEAGLRNPARGSKLVREGGVLYQYYTPRSYSVRCYCSLFRSTDNSLVVSPTYCHCSKGFAQRVWESVLERPVKVELVHSSISGAQECKFAISLLQP